MKKKFIILDIFSRQRKSAMLFTLMCHWNRKKAFIKKSREKESRLSSGHRENLLNPIQIGLTSCFYASTLLYHLLLLRMTLIWNNDVSSRAFCHTHTIAHTLHMMHDYKSKYTPWLYRIFISFSLSRRKFLFFTHRHIIHEYSSAKTTLQNGFFARLLWIISTHHMYISAEDSVFFFVCLVLFQFSGKWLDGKAHINKPYLRCRVNGPKYSSVTFYIVSKIWSRGEHNFLLSQNYQSINISDIW